MQRSVITRRTAGAMVLSSLAAASFGQARAAGKPASAAAPAPIAAPEWPTRPVRLLIGFPPGSVFDIAARVVADPLSAALGQPVIVDYKPGAGGTIAATQVARSTDMHTFTLVNNTLLTTAKLLNPGIGYEPSKDLEPVALLAASPLVFVVSNRAEGTNSRQWLTWLRNLGDSGNYGTPGIGTVGHLGMELVKMRTGVMAQPIPYKGNPEIVTAMLAGQVQCALLPPSLIEKHVEAGKMHVIGVASDKRTDLAPNFPTLREAGVFGADVELWAALAGPATLPKAVRDRLATVSLGLLDDKQIHSRLLQAGWQPAPMGADSLKAQMRHDMATFGGIIVMRGIKA